MKKLLKISFIWIAVTGLYILFRMAHGLAPSSGSFEISLLMFGWMTMASMQTLKQKLTADLFLLFWLASTAIALLAIWWHPKEAVDIFVALTIAWAEVAIYMIWLSRSGRKTEQLPE